MGDNPIHTQTNNRSAVGHKTLHVGGSTPEFKRRLPHAAVKSSRARGESVYRPAVLIRRHSAILCRGLTGC